MRSSRRAAALDVRRRLAVVSAERLGRLDLAARWFEEVAAEAPSAETLGALARVHRKMGAPRELARTLERLADIAPAAAARKELLLEVAKIMAEQLADRDGAIAAYKKILAVDPEDPNALRLLGKLLGAAERWDDLADVLSREVTVADRHPNFVAEAAELRFRLGRIRHQRLADAEGALACYREVLSKVPRHPAALAALEDLARGTGGAAIQAALVLEPIYSAEGEHQKVIDALESRASNETEPATRAALLRRVAETYGGALRNPEMAFLAAGRALAADPDAKETLSLVGAYAAAAGLARRARGAPRRARRPGPRARRPRRVPAAHRAAREGRPCPRRRGVAARARPRPGGPRGDARQHRGAARRRRSRGVRAGDPARPRGGGGSARYGPGSSPTSRRSRTSG